MMSRDGIGLDLGYKK